MRRTVFFVSCRTGITVQTMGQGLLTQFQGVPFEFISRPYVDTLRKAEDLVGDINRARERDQVRPVVFSTLIDPQVRGVVAASEGVFFDFLERFVDPLEEELGVKPSPAIGLSHGLVDYQRYMTRIDAVGYAQLHDERPGARDYHDADLVLVGVSRSGKTPTCLYMALQFGLRAANFTLTEDHLHAGCLPAKLDHCRERLFGLTIDPQRLHRIRSQCRPDTPYATLAQCRHETGLAEGLFRTEAIPFANATAASIEEIATKILQARKLRRRI